jgi:hypothetical protein
MFWLLNSMKNYIAKIFSYLESPEIQRQLNFGSRGVEAGMLRNSPSQCVSLFAEEGSGYAPDVHQFLAKFHRFGPEIVIFSIFGKFCFSHNS